MPEQLNLRQKLLAGETVMGPFLTMPSPDVVEMIAIAGFDFAIVDTEHGMYSEERAAQLVRAAAARSMAAVVRVPQVDPPQITKALDMGAQGVMVPQISSPEAAARAVAAARYHPLGNRGVMAHVRNADYSSLGDPGFYERENERAAVILQIEGSEGIECLPQLCRLDGVDCFFIGVMDLSQSLGVPGQPEHPAVIEQVAATVDLCGRYGKALGIYAFDPEPARRWLDMGIQFLGYHTDAGVMVEAFRRLRRQLAQ